MKVNPPSSTIDPILRLAGQRKQALFFFAQVLRFIQADIRTGAPLILGKL